MASLASLVERFGRADSANVSHLIQQALKSDRPDLTREQLLSINQELLDLVDRIQFLGNKNLDLEMALGQEKEAANEMADKIVSLRSQLMAARRENDDAIHQMEAQRRRSSNLQVALDKQIEANERLVRQIKSCQFSLDLIKSLAPSRQPTTYKRIVSPDEAATSSFACPGCHAIGKWVNGETGFGQMISSMPSDFANMIGRRFQCRCGDLLEIYWVRPAAGQSDDL